MNMIQDFGYTAFFVNKKIELMPFREDMLNNLYNVLFIAHERQSNG